jgi:putative hemolysin
MKRLRVVPSPVVVALAATCLWMMSEVARADDSASMLQIDSGHSWVEIICLILAVLLSAIFVGAETALDLLRPMHVRHAKERSNKKAQKLEWQMAHRPSLVAAAILARQTLKLSMVFFCIVLASKLAATPGGDTIFSLAIFYSLVIIVPLGLLSMVIDLVPKSYAALHPHRVALRLDPFMKAAWAIFSLPAALITFVANMLTSRFGGRATFEIENPVEEEIKGIVESAEETGEIEVAERDMIHSVFEFTDTVARQIMTPRVDLDAVSIKSDPMEVVKVVQESGHSRIPIYEDTDDQIIGIIHAKDILLAANDKSRPLSLRRLMRPALFVPENKSLHDLLAEMKKARTQIAIVQDEFGGTAGVVTIEDIAEELFGDIVDEYDEEEPEAVRDQEGLLVDGKTHLDEINEMLGSELESEEFDTIGGFVFGLFGRQPKPEECIENEPWRFCVIDTNGRRILKLRIEKLADLSGQEALDLAE